MASVSSRRSIALAVVGVPLIGLALVTARSGVLNPYRDCANYGILYTTPPGHWKAIPHSPESLFLFQNTESHILLRGAVSQIISEINPTPELDTDGIAQFYIDRTHDNMPGWTAEMLDRVEADQTAFRMIKRTRLNKEVVTAYAVKGNTTLMVTLSGNSGQIRAVEEGMPEFRSYLASIGMRQQDMSKL